MERARNIQWEEEHGEDSILIGVIRNDEKETQLDSKKGEKTGLTYFVDFPPLILPDKKENEIITVKDVWDVRKLDTSEKRGAIYKTGYGISRTSLPSDNSHSKKTVIIGESRRAGANSTDNEKATVKHPELYE